MKWLPISIYYFLRLFAFQFCLTTKYNFVSLASTSGISTPFPISFSTNDLSLLDCALSFMLLSLPLLVIYWPTQLKYIAYLPILLTYRSLKESEFKTTILRQRLCHPDHSGFQTFEPPPFLFPTFSIFSHNYCPVQTALIKPSHYTYGTVTTLLFKYNHLLIIRAQYGLLHDRRVWQIRISERFNAPLNDIYSLA